MVLYRELGGSAIKFLVSAAVILLTPVLAAKLVFNVTSSTGAEPINEPWVQNSMEFVTWNGEKWTGWVRNEDFALRPQNEGKWSQHSNSMLAFMDWEGTPWQARIDGDSFLLAHHGDWQGHTEKALAIHYRDWQGKNQLRTLAQLKR
jgi:hypothetical protein|tara:strand:- start:8 stop:448 length:441 start_codon:yes stop_codon:yes gene_type:complete